MSSYDVAKGHTVFLLEVAEDKDETTVGTVGTAGAKLK